MVNKQQPFLLHIKNLKNILDNFLIGVTLYVITISEIKIQILKNLVF